MRSIFIIFIPSWACVSCETKKQTGDGTRLGLSPVKGGFHWSDAGHVWLMGDQKRLAGAARLGLPPVVGVDH